MTDIALLGIQVNTTTVPVATKQLDAMTVSAGKAEMAAQDLAAVSRGRLVTGMSAGGNQSRMMAMQLSQVAQQASATGNVVQALAIQLPDMALGFGTAGIAAGVLASVALPLLATAFTSAGSQAKALDDAVAAMSEAVDTFIASSKEAAAPAAKLAETYGHLADEAQRALAAIASADQAAAVREIQTAIDAVTQSLLEAELVTGAFGRGVSIQTLADDFGLAADKAGELQASILLLSRAEGLEAQAQAASRVIRALDAARDSAGKLPAPLQAAYDAVARIVPKAAEVNAKTDQMAELLRSAALAADSAAAAVGGIGTAASNAYGAVSSLVGKMREIAAAQAQTIKDSSLNYGKVVNSGGVDAIARAGNNAMGVDLKGTMANGAGGVFKPDGGASGGGGGADPYQSQLDALVENLRSERAIEDEWYAENLAILTDRRAEEIMGKQAHDAALLSLHEEYQRRISEIDGSANSARLTEAANLFSALASVAEAGGKKQLKTHATLAAAATIISGYQAAMDAAAKAPTLGGKIAAYALWIGQAAKAVSAIRSAGGAGGGGGFSGGSIAAQGATAATGQNIEYRVYGLERDAVYSGAFIEKIFAGLMEEGKKRGLNTQTVQFV